MMFPRLVPDKRPCPGSPCVRTDVCSVELLEPRRLLSAAAGFAQSTFVSGLDRPTQMEFAPDGRLFVSQQGGALRVVKDGQLLPTPFATLPVDDSGERGLLGVAFDPHFDANHYVYVYWTNPSPAPHNQVSRFTADGDTAVPGSEVDLFDLPALSSATNHNGGAIHFGADGKLYVAVGENAHPANAQSLATPLGKLLRINPDGSIPADDPFYAQTTGPARAAWAMGLRNPYTFAVQPGTDRIFIDDVGQDTWEEIDDGVAGANYGWPTTEGEAQPGQQTPANYRDPLYTYNHGPNESQGVAITGGTFYNPPAGVAGTPGAFPASYTGDYFFADYGIGFVKTLDLNQGVASEGYPVTTFAVGLNHPTDLKTGPDGSLYVLEHGTTDTDGAVVRFSSTTSSGTPTPTPTPSPTPAPSPTPVPIGSADVVGSLDGVAASAVQGTRDSAVLRLTNAGTAAASGRVTVQLLLSADPTPDSSDVSLVKVTRTLRLKPGASQTFPLRFRVPSGTSSGKSGGAVPPGAYYLLAQVTPTSASGAAGPGEVIPSNGPVAVAAPFIDLTGAFVTTPAVLAPGKLATATLDVSNAGNSLAAGPLKVALSTATPTGGVGGAVALATVTRAIHLSGGASARLRLAFRVPRNLAAGAYEFTALVDVGNRFAESDEGNNLAASAASFSVP